MFCVLYVRFSVGYGGRQHPASSSQAPGAAAGAGDQAPERAGGEHSHVGVLEAVLSLGAPLEGRDVAGYTALHYVAAIGATARLVPDVPVD